MLDINIYIKKMKRSNCSATWYQQEQKRVISLTVNTYWSDGWGVNLDLKLLQRAISTAEAMK